MSTPDRDTVETVTKLLAERRKVTDWLSALVARRDSTPPAVFQKVHDDYTAKLDKVQAKLVAASDSVQAAAADVAARLTDKEEVLARKQDERAEAELRFSVGEYGEREWEKRRARLDDDLNAATAERDTLRDELHKLRDVLDDVSGVRTAATAMDEEPASAEPSAELTDAAAAPEFEPDAPMSAPGAQSGVESELPAAPSIPIHEQAVTAPSAPASIAPVEPTQPLAPSFDELAFLKAVVGRPTPAGARHPAEPALVSKRPTPESKRPLPEPKRPTPAPKRDEPEPSAPAGRAAAPTPPEPNPYALPEPPTPFPDPVPEPRVSQEMTPPRESFFGRPTPRTSEAVKSLRCQECGTLNYPTEWYCERCGGELAAF
jgi:hypothetical protein